MTRVDFYILPERNTHAAVNYSARLVEKAFRRGHDIYVHTATEAQTEALSEALWQRPNSFLGHQCGEQDGHCAIRLCHSGDPSQHGDVMVNLSGDIPTFFSRFQRVAEIVPADPNSRTQSRKNYRFYQDRGYALNTHNIK